MHESTAICAFKVSRQRLPGAHALHVDEGGSQRTHGGNAGQAGQQQEDEDGKDGGSSHDLRGDFGLGGKFLSPATPGDLTQLYHALLEMERPHANFSSGPRH
jgi:hypothetical protein